MPENTESVQQDTTAQSDQATAPDQQLCREISVIVEINADSLRHLEKIVSPDHGRSVKEVLELHTFGDVEVIAATHPHVPKPADICKVPHFGHSASCDDPCDGPGVYRLFEVAAVVEPDATTDIFGRYNIGGHIEIDVCGLRHKPKPVTALPEFIDGNDVPPVGRFGRDYEPDATDNTDESDARRDRLGIGASIDRNSTLSEHYS